MDCPFPGMVHISGVHPTGSILIFRRLSRAKSREINAEMQAKTPKVHLSEYRNTL